MLARLREFLHGFEWRATGKWFALSIVIGVVSGLGAIVFQFLSHAVMYYTLGQSAGYLPKETNGEHAFFLAQAGELNLGMLVVVLVGGGLVSGLLVYTFAPEAEGHGTDAAIEAFHHKRGYVRGRIPFIKTITSAVTIGTGGSGGREGPIAQIGAGFGSFLATRLKLSARDRRILLAAGMGAGVGAIFRAPLAGALFAGEILYKDADLESDVIIPAAMSSIVGYSVFRLSLPESKRFLPLFGRAIEFPPMSALELVPLALLSLVLVLVSIMYINTFYGTHRLFKKLPVVPHLKPAIGAGLAGLFAVVLFVGFDRDLRVLGVLGTGYGTLQEALNPSTDLALPLLLAVALGKIITTSLTISSGGSGGVFGPSMVIGGCTGAAVGQFIQQRIPQFASLPPQAYAIVGMAGFFAGAAHAPFSTIIMVSEMTGNYNLLLPTMWVSTLCFLLCRRWTLYVKQVPTRLESPAHRGDFIVDLLEGITVDEVYRKDRKIHTVPESTTLDEIVHMLARTHQQYFPVVDASGRMVGIFSADDVRAYLFDETIWQLALARDVMVSRIVSVTPDDDLNSALRKFTALNLDELPVLDPSDSGKLLGMLRRKETIGFYNKRLMEYKQSDGE